MTRSASELVEDEDERADLIGHEIPSPFGDRFRQDFFEFAFSAASRSKAIVDRSVPCKELAANDSLLDDNDR